MSNIRELSFDEIALVSGGNANSNYEGGGSRSRNTGARNSLGRNAPTHIYSDPSTVKCANAVFSGMVGGAIKELLVGQLSASVSPVEEMVTEAETELVPVIVQEVTSVVPVVDK